MMRWHAVVEGRFDGTHDEALDEFLDRFTDVLTDLVDDLSVGASLASGVVELEFDVFADDLDHAHRLARSAVDAAMTKGGAEHFDPHREVTERVLEPV